ncbi:MAG: PilZ domain-containing protein [Myxococcota bacterium]
MSEPGGEQRRSKRFAAELPVEVFRGGQRSSGRTKDVSRHGLFLVLDPPPPERLLLRFTLDMPDGALEATGFVTRQVRSPQLVGAGIQFFALASAAKARWDAYISAVSTGTTPSSAVAPHPQDDGATFLIKLKDTKRLVEFFERRMRAGQVFMNTPLARPVGSNVSLILIHPESEREFLVRGKVTKVDTSQRGMNIEIDALTPKLEQRFHDFVQTGVPSETMDLVVHPEKGRLQTADTPPVAEPAGASPGPVAARLEEEADVPTGFEVDDQTGDLSLDIEVEDESLADIEGFAGLPPPPAEPPDPNTVVVRCTSCGAFLGPAPIAPLPEALQRVLVRRTSFDRFAGSFSSVIEPRTENELEAAEVLMGAQTVPAVLLVEMARHWVNAPKERPRGVDMGPAIESAAEQLKVKRDKARLATPCPMCGSETLFATWH